jgi:DNA adenine methylase
MNHRPIVPWIGGKRRLLKHLLPLPEHQTYVEPFAGGAAVLFAKLPSKVEIINDLHGELTNLYRVVKHHLDELVRQFRWSLASRQQWLWHQAEAPETLTDVQRAARFLFLQKMAFGGKVAQQSFGISPSGPPRLNLLRLEEELSQAHLRLARVWIETGTWSHCIERHDRPGTLFFCDPPYWRTEGYGAEFPWDQYVALEQQLRECRGNALITLGGHPDILDLFTRPEWLIQPVQIDYTLAGSHRPSRATELIIRKALNLTSDQT